MEQWLSLLDSTIRGATPLVRAALAGAGGPVVQVIGAPELTGLYAKAITLCGGFAERHDGEAVVRGLSLIAEHARWN